MTMNGIVTQIISVVVWGGFSPFQVSEQNNTARTVVNRSWNQNYIILHGTLSLGTKRENCCGVSKSWDQNKRSLHPIENMSLVKSRNKNSALIQLQREPRARVE